MTTKQSQAIGFVVVIVLTLGWLVLALILTSCSSQPPPPINQPEVAQATPEPTPQPTPSPAPTPDPWATYLPYGPEHKLNTSLLHAVDIQLAPDEQVTDVFTSNSEQWVIVPIKARAGHVVISQKAADAMPAEIYIYTDSEHVYRLMLKPHDNRKDYPRVLRFN